MEQYNHKKMFKNSPSMFYNLIINIEGDNEYVYLYQSTHFINSCVFSSSNSFWSKHDKFSHYPWHVCVVFILN